MRFVPFEIGSYECDISFFDREVGEFMYRIEGVSRQPAVIPQAVQWTCKSFSVIKKTVRIPHENTQRDRALQSVLAFEENEKDQSEDSPRKQIVAKIDDKKFQLPFAPLKYKVHFSSPFFSGPDEILIAPINDNHTAKDKQFGMSSQENSLCELPITFAPKVIFL